MNALEKIRYLRLGRLRGSLDSALSGAAFTEVQQAHARALDLRELNYSIPFLANVADHSTPLTRGRPILRPATRPFIIYTIASPTTVSLNLPPSSSSTLPALAAS